MSGSHLQKTKKKNKTKKQTTCLIGITYVTRFIISNELWKLLRFPGCQATFNEKNIGKLKKK